MHEKGSAGQMPHGAFQMKKRLKSVFSNGIFYKFHKERMRDQRL